MKRTILTLFTAACLLGGAAPALAQSEKPKKVSRAEAAAAAAKTAQSEKQKQRGQAEAPALVAATGVACTITDATYRGQSTAADKSKNEHYEVSCQEGLGYLVSKSAAGVNSAFDCVAAFSASKVGPDGTRSGTVCELPGNADPKAGLQPFVTKASVACTVRDAVWLGYSQTGKLNRYEVACQEGFGYVLDRNDDGSAAARTCLSSGPTCTLTTRAQNAASLAPLVAKTGRACSISDGRAVGSSTSTGALFYEIACAGGPGFMLEARTDGTARAVDCLQAGGIGGGCTLTNVATALADRTQTYVSTLKTLGADCADAQARVVGLQRVGSVEREAAEIKCSNRPLGVLLLTPTVAGQGKSEFTDCIGAGRFGVKCELTPAQTILQGLTTAIRAVPRNCDVADYRYMSASADGDIIEVDCSGADQNAFVMDLPPARVRPVRTIPCSDWLARGGERCALPGNAGK